jgi:DNA-binding winged helix-turn-helix (wHTH) protein/dipeptidyl aminopeptidase/acylaminoacyl peptidase
MAAQYWVGDFFIDLTRNQITKKTQSQTIPPKALAVLTCLAKNANTVVSQDELLSEVWPNTIVTPNTLQRSIAQLRKVLDHNGQSQSYIKTHPKQGYSLEVEVNWQDKTDLKSLDEDVILANIDANLTTPEIETATTTPELTTDEIEQSKSSKYNTLTFKILSIVTGIAIVLFLGWKYDSSTNPLNFRVAELRSLTATDHKEFGAIYSPNGDYIVFLRYSEKICINSNLWAKNTKTKKETQLTNNMGAYGNPSFSKDGKRLVFVESQSCNKPITQKNCYKLMTLDFDKALQSKQSPNTLMECKNSRIKRPTWLNNNDIAFLQTTENRWKLVSYSISDNKSKPIYMLQNGSIVDYDFSVSDNLIALTSIHSDDQNYIEILKPNGQLLSSHQIEYPTEIANRRFITPNFTPMGEHLIFSTGRQLFTLSTQGKVTNISLPLDEPMGTPIFHPNSKRMLMIKGHWDSDIITMSLSKLSQFHSDQTKSIQNSNFTILERSTLGEENAMYQPHGALIAFTSGRSGEKQIWLTDGNGAQQLSHFQLDTYISGSDWAADGKSILVNANNKLTQVSLDSSKKSFAFGHRVEQLFQFNSEENTALIIARIKGIKTFGELNLNSLAFQKINHQQVKWALKSADGKLIYSDHMDRFWQPGAAEDQLIEILENQGSERNFITKNNIIYGINEDNQMWSYHLNNEAFKIIGEVPEMVDYLTDINQSHILMELRITAKKEVAEIILADE